MADLACNIELPRPALALSTGSLPWYGIDRVFAFAANAGLDGIEVEIDERFDTRHPGYLADLAERYAIPILAIHSPQRHVSGYTRSYRELVHEMIRLAEAVNARTVVFNPTLYNPALFIKYLHMHLGPAQAQTPIKLAIENLPLAWRRHWLLFRRPQHRFHSIAQVRAYPALAFNTAHFGSAGDDILRAWETLAQRTQHILLSDYKPSRAHQHLYFGDGSLPLAAFLQAVAASNYAGTITLAFSPQALGAGDEGIIAGRLRRATNFCLKHLRIHSVHR